MEGKKEREREIGEGRKGERNNFCRKHGDPPVVQLGSDPGFLNFLCKFKFEIEFEIRIDVGRKRSIREMGKRQKYL